MNSGNVTHITFPSHRIVCCKRNEAKCLTILPACFVVEANVQVGVKLCGTSSFFARPQDFVRLHRAGKQLLDLRHWNARGTRDWKQCFLRRFKGTFRSAKDTQEMPDCVLDILRVDSLMKFELTG